MKNLSDDELKTLINTLRDGKISVFEYEDEASRIKIVTDKSGSEVDTNEKK